MIMKEMCLLFEEAVLYRIVWTVQLKSTKGTDLGPLCIVHSLPEQHMQAIDGKKTQ